MNIQEVKNIRIADYLQSLGYTPVKQQGNSLWYKSPLREEKDASFKVNTELNKWYDFGLGKGGNIIALAEELYATDYVPYLLNKNIRTSTAYPSRIFLFSSASIRTEFPTVGGGRTYPSRIAQILAGTRYKLRLGKAGM